MRKVLTLCLLLCGVTTAFTQSVCPVIPRPLSAETPGGSFPLGPGTAIYSQHQLFQGLDTYLQKEILAYTGIATRIGRQAAPTLILLEKKAQEKPGAYAIEMNPGRVRISAADREGMFHGITSFLQLSRTAKRSGNHRNIACWNIEDAPFYAWRGLMLDESRHFYGKETVKFILDWMAFYKLNRFHWHLTDSPGWRLQIQKYPRLALVGGIGNKSDSLAPATYYTQEDIAEIVSYAQERHIKIIPEIDMPGHARAANRAYPAFSGGGSEKHPDFTFHPGREGTYAYLTDILRETDALFPAQMIHLGGDEVHFGNEQWKTDTAVQTLMKDQDLENLKEVEQYFIRRMADSVLKLNNMVLGWDEIAGSGLAPDSVIIFWWRHDKPEVLQETLHKDYPVVLCPRIPLYFDFVQDSLHQSGRRWAGNFAPLQAVYDFSAETVIPEVAERQQVLGMQANLWTETAQSRDRLEFLLFPRISALSEAAWSGPDNKDYEQYKTRLKTHMDLYTAAGIYFYDPFSPASHPEVIK